MCAEVLKHPVDVRSSIDSTRYSYGKRSTRKLPFHLTQSRTLQVTTADNTSCYQNFKTCREVDGWIVIMFNIVDILNCLQFEFEGI